MLNSYEFLAAAVMVAVLLTPLFLLYRRHAAGKPVKNRLLLQIATFFGMGLVMVGLGMNNAMAATPETAAGALSGITDLSVAMIAAALSTGLSGIGGGIAVSAAASAALGAISENPKTFGKAMVFVGLAEGVALYGMIISFMIIGKV